MNSFFAPLSTALRFLTIFPLSWRAGEDELHFGTSLYFFPVVGLIIGSVGYMFATLLSMFLPIQVAAVCMLCYLAFVSGCLHLDGLADSADGLLSSRPRARALEIMKDSRTGAMGVVAIVFILLAKYSALSSMDRQTFCLSVFLMPVVGRCAIVFVMAIQKYARQEGGLGQLFYSKRSKKAALLSLFILLVILVVSAPGLLLLLPIILFVVLFLFTRWCGAKLGGATGDTLGASCEIAEMVTSICLVIIL